MKVFELMSELSEEEAGKDVEVSVCLSPSELMHGEQIDEDTYCLSLKLSKVIYDSENTILATEL